MRTTRPRGGHGSNSKAADGRPDPRERGMEMIKSFKHKAFAAATAGLLALSMVPTAALAESGSKYTSDITVNGLQPGDTVIAYEVVDSIVDSNNNKTTVTDLTDYPETNEALANYVHGLTLQQIQSASKSTLTQTVATGESSVTFQNADDGAWLIVVTPASGDESYIYQNIVVNNDAKVKANSTDYEANPQKVDAKKTDEKNNAHKKIDNEKVQVGETHTFTVTFAVPNYATAATKRKLVITDAPTNWKDDTSSIKIVNSQATTEALTLGTDYTVTASTDGNGFTINFTESYLNAHPNQNLTLTYDAQLTSADATDGSASNTVSINGASDTVSEKTYGFWFEKVDASKEALAGAEFTLYDSDGNEVKDASANTLKSTSDANGYVYFSGLKDGATYTVKETKVPAGKQQAKDFTVTIAAASANEDNPATTDVTETNYQKSGQADDKVVDADQGSLPTTGGAGTIGLTVAGVVFVAGGATLILRARKTQE